jgi:hypothetical protein
VYGRLRLGTELPEKPYKQRLSDTVRYENGRQSPNCKTVYTSSILVVASIQASEFSA